eukprot:1853931-Karenia_brevis.AAC.1
MDVPTLQKLPLDAIFKPEVDGDILVECIFTIWGDGYADVPWFAQDGSRNIVKHELNRNVKEHVVSLYSKRMLGEGLTQDAGNAAWMQYSSATQDGSGRGYPLKALTFNHRAETFYRCSAKFPEN